MKAKVLKLCSLLMALLVMTSLLAACGDSGADEPEAPVSQQEGNGADVDAPDSIEAWYGEYEGDAGTLSITDSLEDMVDFTLEANDGSYMSGTWTVSDSSLGVMEDRELYATYNVEDGSIEITGKTESDNENNASFIGVYYPVE